DVDVRLNRRSFIAGESATLDVVVRGATGSVADPELGLPPGVEVLGSARSQNFSWVNGRSSNETLFRYEIGSERAGRYTLGPVRVRIGNQIYQGASVNLEITSAPRQVGGATRGVAALTADITPAQPYVGEPVLLRVRLVMRAALAEAPEYAPPATTGFWAERASEPETYYAQQGGGRVLVTETRTRLYPLAAGRTTIGEASAALVLADEQSPFSIFGLGQNAVILKSQPVAVMVRPLPPGAPAGFTGAVGDLELSWTADRAQTAVDVPIVVRLDVRGRGNLPLLRRPELVARGYELFGGSLEDSLPAPGSVSGGRRRFQWTVVPARPGRLQIPPPEFHWFDLEQGRYRVLQAAPISVQIGPALGSSENQAGEVFPLVLTRHPVDPGATPARPWALGLGGALLAAAIVAWRGSRPGAERTVVRAQCREWLRAIGLAEGPAFWQAAGDACDWLSASGSPVGSLGREISAARFGGQFTDEQRIRRRMVELLSAALERGAPSPAAAIVAGVLAVTAVALVLVLGPHAGDDRGRQRARAADERARQGNLDAAAVEWRGLWQDGHHPGLAARLAWVDVRAGNIGGAAAWILRGDGGEARDAGLNFVAERVREAGGLAGGWHGRLSVRSLEWGLLSAILAGAGILFWPNRARAGLGVFLAVLAAAAPVLEGAERSSANRAVVLRATPLAGADVELEAGQVVRVISRAEGESVVRVGTIEGRVPTDLLARVEEPPPAPAMRTAPVTPASP
ncbi:MAG: BatD family protein, partial [Candidatus Eisenbacteria bacterium]